MAAQPYPMGTFPQQFFGGGISRSKFTPNAGGPSNPFTGGVVFAGGTLQNTKLFDSTFGCLNYPYLGQHNQYNDNKPYGSYINPGAGWGITKAISNGTFSTMTKGQYVILTFNTQLAGVATTVLQSPGSSYRKSENKNIGWVDTVLYNKNNAGGFYMLNGLPVAAVNTRDNINTEPASTYAAPGRLTFNSTGKLANVQGYRSKSD